MEYAAFATRRTRHVPPRAQRALNVGEWGETGALRVRMGIHTGLRQVKGLLRQLTGTGPRLM
jgi:hypothetical protein